MAKSSKAAIGYQLGRLVEQSGGMVDAVVHPALLKDSEARLLKNTSNSEKGTVKTTRGRQERFAEPFDANNPCNGLTAYYPDTSTSRLVMGSGTKLYSDTPHLIESFDSEDEWGTWEGNGIDKTGGNLKLAKVYAINTLGTTSTANSSTSEYEMGWKFTVGDKPLLLTGFRLNAAKDGNATVRLWKNSDKSKLKEITIPGQKDTWKEVVFDGITLEAADSYVVSIGVPQNTDYKQINKGSNNYNDLITCDEGRKSTTLGNFPETTDTNIFGIIDLILWDNNVLPSITHTSKEDWDAQEIEDLDTAASPGEVKLAKEGVDLALTDDFETGILNNLRVTVGGLELDGVSSAWSDFAGKTWEEI